MGARRGGLGFAGRPGPRAYRLRRDGWLYGTIDGTRIEDALQADDRHTPGPDVSELSADGRFGWCPWLCRWLDRLDR